LVLAKDKVTQCDVTADNSS